MFKGKFGRSAILGFTLCLAIISCSHNPADFESNEIAVVVSKKDLTIINKLKKPIYYFAFSPLAGADRDWTPYSSDENKINPRQNKKLNLNDISRYEEGKQIIIYYWSAIEPASSSIKNLVVKT